jgi:hypothetical protein
MAEVKEMPKKPKNPFGPTKAADLVIYRLVEKNDIRLREDTNQYRPYIRFPNTDIIKWNFGTDGEPDWQERAIRYLPGYSSIFVDEQEKGGREIPQAVLDNPNNRFEITDGYIRVRPSEATKIKFLDYCNRNVDSPFRTGRMEGIFEKYSEEKTTEKKSAKLDMQKEAIEKAYSADAAQISFHAKYLGIPLYDETGGTRKLDAIITDYRQVAIDDPKKFIDTYDDADLKLRFKIERALEGGFVNTRVVAGKAVYGATKQEICDIPQGTDEKGIVDVLFLFAQTKNGSDFYKKVSEYGN